MLLTVGDGQVEVAVAGEIARHQIEPLGPPPPRTSTWGWNVPSPLPRSIWTPCRRVGDGEVEVAVAGEVTRHDADVGHAPTA